MSKVQIIETISEIGAGTRGASMGIQAMKMASLNAKSDYFSKIKSVEVEHLNHLLFEQNETPNALRIEGIVQVYKNISKVMKDTFEAGKFPLVLAGDHSSAGGTIAGIKAMYPNKRLGVIWVDAHADLHSPYTSPSGNVHGMPLAVSANEDNLDRQVNHDVSDKSKQLWEDLKNVGGISPKINYEDLVFIGVRDTEEPEDYLIEKNNIKNISVSEIRVNGINETIKNVEAYLSECDMIYISFDVDSMDSSYVSKGTGTPVEIGFTENEATEILQLLLANEKVCCFEITEINPTLDNKCNVMAETAFRVLEKSTNTLKGRL